MANLFTYSPSPTSWSSCCHKACRILSLCPSPQTLLTQQGLQDPLVPKSQCFLKVQTDCFGVWHSREWAPTLALFGAAALFFVFLLLLFICFTHCSLCKMFSEGRSRKSIWKSLFLFNIEVFSINDIKLTSVSVTRLLFLSVSAHLSDSC